MARSDSGHLANAQQPAVVEASIKDRLGQQRLSLTYDKTKQAFALGDERTRLSISEFTIQLTSKVGTEKTDLAEILTAGARAGGAYCQWPARQRHRAH